jgi:hypothetical protein
VDEFEQNRQGKKEKKRNEIKDNQNNVWGDRAGGRLFNDGNGESVV